MPSKNYVDFAASHRTLPANAQRVAEVSPEERITVSIYLKPRPDTGLADAALPGTDRRAALRMHRAAQHQADITLLHAFAAAHSRRLGRGQPADQRGASCPAPGEDDRHGRAHASGVRNAPRLLP